MNNTEHLDSNESELLKSLCERVCAVYEVFKDFFGEDKVDLQDMPNEEFITKLVKSGENIKHIIETDSTRIIQSKYGINPFILVYFPEVKITNEHDKYIIIKNLYAKVSVNFNGTLTGTFLLNRSSYTPTQYESDYMHSHISSIPKDNPSVFKSPCLGSGPIKGTALTLNTTYDLSIWALFCFELSKYVTVESIAGTPYHYLERIGKETMDKVTTTFSPSMYYDNIPLCIRDFIPYFISKVALKFNFIHGNYSIAMSGIDWYITISNAFIEWYNEVDKNYKYPPRKVLLNMGVLIRCKIDGECVYIPKASRFIANLGGYVCTFKGKRITLTAEEKINEAENISTLLNIQISNYILTKILEIVNYKYGNPKFKTNTKVIYL